MVYSEVQIVDGAGHYLWYSTPAAVLSAIQDAWDWADELDNTPPDVLHARPAPTNDTPPGGG
jgi:hypothetical protein